MATIPEITDRLEAATEKAENASQIIYDVANGDASTEVPTASGPTPTLKKWFQDLGGSLEPMLAGIPARLDKAILEYPNKVDADSAAISLPNGQQVYVLSERAQYYVSSGLLVFSNYLGAKDTGSNISTSAGWTDIPEISIYGENVDSNKQAKSLGNRSEVVKKAINGSYAINGGPASNPESAIITHTKNSFCTYDLITLQHSRWQTLRKIYPDGATVANGATTPSGGTVKGVANSRGLRVVTNADGGRTVAGGLRPIGLQISDGVLYLDWLPGETFPEAIVMMDDGTLVEATAADGISGAQWVAAGARWSAGFGWTCVREGVAINLDSKPAPFDGATVSARTVIGQKYDGTILIALVEGRTGSYGITGTQSGELMASLGCRIAHVLDGGGSTQCWWSNCYAMPSSDSLFSAERSVPSFFSIDLPVSNFDTGWQYINQAPGITSNGAGFAPVAIRQLGPNVQISVNAAGAFTSDTAVKLSDGAIPDRFTPPNSALMRLNVSGGSGYPASIYYASNALYVRAGSQTLAYCSGSSSWPVKFSGLPAVLY